MHILIHGDFSKTEILGAGAIITDPPYGVTNNAWDTAPVDFLPWAIASSEEDSAIVCTADMRYAAFCLSQHLTLFSHDLVWSKTVGSGQLNINRRPLRTHENILVFKKGKGYYRRVFEQGKPYSINRKIDTKQCYGQQKEHTAVNEGTRDRKTVVNIPNPRVRGGHPTQKPIDLFQWLCDSYGKGFVVDPFAGSGTILDVVGFTTIGIEASDEYYGAARAMRKDRIIEEEPTAELLKLIPSLQNLEYTAFSSKS